MKMTDELTIEALAEKHHPQLLLRALELARKRRSFSQDLDEYEDCISMPWPLPNEAEAEAWKRGGSEEYGATAMYAHRTECRMAAAQHFFRWYFQPEEEIGAAIRQHWADMELKRCQEGGRRVEVAECDYCQGSDEAAVHGGMCAECARDAEMDAAARQRGADALAPSIEGGQ